MKKYLVLAASLAVLGSVSAHAQTFPSTTFDNSARVTQTGNNNRAVIDQAVGGIINGQNTAEIIQNGNLNRGTITQSSATNPVTGGFDNTALIDQRRSRGEATIDQIHDYLAARDNRATIVQITADAKASIQQRGDRNTATVRQLAGSFRPTANVDQNGRINTAIVRQAGANGVVNVFQGTYQAGPGASGETFNSRVEIDNNGQNANIFVSQIGTGHDAIVFEAGSNGLITVSMAGALNSVNVLQQSTDGVVEITSTGTSASNIAEVTQAASDVGSTARVLQTGRYAESDIMQSDTVLGGGANLADVTQTGNGLTVGSILSTVAQNGGDNLAMVSQAGAYATSGITQTGIGHTANVSQ
jgi:hypothetical protein